VARLRAPRRRAEPHLPAVPQQHRRPPPSRSRRFSTRQSRFAARKELAKELGYTGDSNDSASMNIWLHKQVMAKLAANGGKLPPDIKH
jgi:hypothetical protein